MPGADTVLPGMLAACSSGNIAVLTVGRKGNRVAVSVVFSRPHSARDIAEIEELFERMGLGRDKQIHKFSDVSDSKAQLEACRRILEQSPERESDLD
jgi:hypothetical protein